MSSYVENDGRLTRQAFYSYGGSRREQGIAHLVPDSSDEHHSQGRRIQHLKVASPARLRLFTAHGEFESRVIQMTEETSR